VVAIEATNLYKSYGENQVLKGLDITINEGEAVVILGRSGVGKSVLLRQILGIEKPDKGTIKIDGKDLWHLSKQQRRALTMEMGMLFQRGALFDSLTVGKNVAFYLEQHFPQMKPKEVRMKVAEALEMVDLAGTEEKMPSDLSGGMQKRAALARVIIYRPKIVLFDEPTTGLDPITSMQINNLIIRTKEVLGATVIAVTHDIKSAFMIGDRLAFHNNKKIQRIAPKDSFFKGADPEILTFFENAKFTDLDNLEMQGAHK
jgi:phospholipid/cholesterol/gamma-HCH transport system ATP-binding protein